MFLRSSCIGSILPTVLIMYVYMYCIHSLATRLSTTNSGKPGNEVTVLSYTLHSRQGYAHAIVSIALLPGLPLRTVESLGTRLLYCHNIHYIVSKGMHMLLQHFLIFMLECIHGS